MFYLTKGTIEACTFGFLGVCNDVHLVVTRQLRLSWSQNNHWIHGPYIRYTHLAKESSLYSKPMTIILHVLVYQSYNASYQPIIKAVTKLYKNRHAHVICLLSQLTYYTFLRKAVISVYLPHALTQVIQQHKSIL
jgi:hypothetical protein